MIKKNSSFRNWDLIKDCYLSRPAMVGWMTCDFTSFSTVFLSHQDDGRVIAKACVQWNPFTVGKISAFSGARTAGQR